MEKKIRFIDIHYNDLFTVNDGDVVEIVYSDGSKYSQVCKYIDETHFYFGKDCWHIHQFAEFIKFSRKGAKCRPCPAPEMAYTEVKPLKYEYPSFGSDDFSHFGGVPISDQEIQKWVLQCIDRLSKDPTKQVSNIRSGNTNVIAFRYPSSPNNIDVIVCRGYDIASCKLLEENK